MNNIDESKKIIEAAINSASKNPGKYEKRLINNSVFGLHFKGSPNLYFANFDKDMCEVAVDDRDGQPHSFNRIPTSALKEIIAAFDTSIAGWPGGNDRVKAAIHQNKVETPETVDKKFLQEGVNNAFGPTDSERVFALNRFEDILTRNSHSMIFAQLLASGSERLFYAATSDGIKVESAFFAHKAHSRIPGHAREADEMLAKAFHLRKTVPGMEEKCVAELEEQIPLSANATQEELKKWGVRAERLHELATAHNSDTISRLLAKKASFAAAQCYSRLGDVEKAKKWKAINDKERADLSKQTASLQAQALGKGIAKGLGSCLRGTKYTHGQSDAESNGL